MKQTIMLVEDEEDTATLLKSILEREGFSVLHAKDGRQAAVLIQTIRPPSLVLLDLIIPFVSGSEVLRMTRELPAWKQTPIVVLSANSYEPDIQRALGEGATAYVTKQKGSAGLLQAVKRLLPATPPQDQIVAKAGSTAPRTRRTSVHHRPRGNRRRKRAA